MNGRKQFPWLYYDFPPELAICNKFRCCFRKNVILPISGHFRWLLWNFTSSHVDPKLCVVYSYCTREEADTVQVLRSWRCSKRRRGTSFNARKQWKSNTHNKLPLPEVSRWGRVIEQLLFRLQFNRVQECFCVKFDKLLLFPFPHPPAPSMLVVWGWFMVDWGGHK